MNTPTDRDADGGDSYEIGGDEKSDYSSKHISDRASQCKTSDERGRGGDGKEGRKSYDGELFETARTGDGESGGSGVAVCGVAAAKVGGRRIGVKKLLRGNNYRLDEDLNFLQIMEEILPITDEEWTSVVEQHNESNPDFDRVGKRNGDSLRRRYRTLYSKRAPSGDPRCPENVRIAKRIRSAIFQRTQASTGTTSDEDSCEETRQFTNTDLIASPERAAQEDCQHQQEMMMQMMIHNQQMMMAVLATFEREAREDRQHQQAMMMQMMNHNQQMMTAILATLGNKNNDNNSDSNTQNNNKKSR